MDWTSVFAAVGAVFLTVSAAVAVSTVTVLAWIGLRYIAQVWADEQRQIAAVDRVAEEWRREQEKRRG